MGYTPKPHVSLAVQHARFSVSIVALVLGLCLFGQVAVWAIVHYTDVRIAEVKPQPVGPSFNIVNDEPSQAQLSVVSNDEAVADAGTKDVAIDSDNLEDIASFLDELDEDEAPLAAPATVATQSEPVDANQVQSAGDIMLFRFSNLVRSVGVLSAVLLMVVMFQATVIAGGASIPGVEKCVSASTMSILIGLLCLPLGTLVPSLPFGGIFLTYEELVRSSIAFRDGWPGAPGALGFFGWHLIIPFIAIGGLLMVILRFRSGVEAGVIVTNVSQLDEKLESEIRNMKLGQLAAPRSMGALNSAIGDSDAAPGGAPEGDMKKAAGAEGMSSRPGRLI